MHTLKMGKTFSKGKKAKPRNRGAERHSSTRGPFLTRHPLQGLPLQVRREIVAELTDAAKERFAASMQRLVEISGEVSPFHALSILSSYALMGALPEPGKKRIGGQSQSGAVHQGQVEFLQALLLRHPLDMRSPPPPDLMQEIFDGLPTLFEAYSTMRVPEFGSEGIDKELVAAEAVKGILRGHTAVVRNWGYYSEVKRIASELLGTLDAEFRSEHGLTLTQVIAVFDHLVRRLEDSVNDYRFRMHAAFHAGKPPHMWSKLVEMFPAVQDLDALKAELHTPGLDREQGQYRVLIALEGLLPLYFFFKAEDVADAMSLGKTTTSALLKKLSLPFGALQDRTPESLLLDNPVWTHPLIEVESDVYFCALPQSLMSFVFPIAEGLIKPHPSLHERLKRVRTRYLEDSTERALRQAFPGCNVARGYKWMEGDRQYESDLVLQYDATILLVESKSGGVSWPALRGAPGRMVKHIQELIVDPSDQSARLAERLKEAIGGYAGPVADFPLPLAGVRAISRLSVTLHDFATIQSIPFLLQEAGLIRSEHRLAPCISLADLQVVVEILDAPYLRMHYLRRRAELLLTATTFGDELDTVGMYLDTGFNLGDAEAGEKQVMMSGYSARIDRYYMAVDEGVKAKKPKANISPWIRSLCDQLMDRAPVGWYEMAHVLLSLGDDEQRGVEREVRSRAKYMESGRPAKNGLDSVILIPPPHRRLAVAFLVRAPGDPRSSAELASDIACQTFETSYVESCAVFSFQANIKGLPYRSAGLLFRSDRPVEARTYL